MINYGGLSCLLKSILVDLQCDQQCMVSWLGSLFYFGSSITLFGIELMGHSGWCSSFYCGEMLLCCSLFLYIYGLVDLIYGSMCIMDALCLTFMYGDLFSCCFSDFWTWNVMICSMVGLIYGSMHIMDASCLTFTLGDLCSYFSLGFELGMWLYVLIEVRYFLKEFVHMAALKMNIWLKIFFFVNKGNCIS